MVDQDSAGHPTLLGTNQRINYQCADAVVRSHEVLDVNEVLCTVDIRHNALDRPTYIMA